MKHPDPGSEDGDVIRGFDPDSENYKCCCRRVHVKTGTIVMSILNSFGLSAAFARIVSSTVILKTSSLAYTPTIISGFLLSTNLVAVVLMFIGIFKRIPKLLTPLLINLICIMIVCVICFVFFGVSFAVASFDVAQKVSVELSVEEKQDDKLSKHSSYNNIFNKTSYSPSSSLLNRNNKDINVDNNNNLTDYDGDSLKKKTETTPETVDQGFQIGIGILVLCFLIVAILNYWIFKVIKTCRTYLTDESNWRRTKCCLSRRYKSTEDGDGCVVIEEGRNCEEEPVFTEVHCSLPTETVNHRERTPPIKNDITSVV